MLILLPLPFMFEPDMWLPDILLGELVPPPAVWLPPSVVVPLVVLVEVLVLIVVVVLFALLVLVPPAGAQPVQSMVIVLNARSVNVRRIKIPLLS